MGQTASSIVPGLRSSSTTTEGPIKVPTSRPCRYERLNEEAVIDKLVTPALEDLFALAVKSNLKVPVPVEFKCPEGSVHTFKKIQLCDRRITSGRRIAQFPDCQIVFTLHQLTASLLKLKPELLTISTDNRDGFYQMDVGVDLSDLSGTLSLQVEGKQCPTTWSPEFWASCRNIKVRFPESFLVLRFWIPFDNCRTQGVSLEHTNPLTGKKEKFVSLTLGPAQIEAGSNACPRWLRNLNLDLLEEQLKDVSVTEHIRLDVESVFTTLFIHLFQEQRPLLCSISDLLRPCSAAASVAEVTV